jgi:hypothetical protein
MVRRGIALAEILVAVALFALVGIALLWLLSGAATGAARAGEQQLAATVGARIVDRLTAYGYEGLAPYAGTGGDLDLGREGENSDAPATPPNGLVMDGFTYGAAYELKQVEEGLMQLTVTVRWQRYGMTASRVSGSMTLIRLVADPLAAALAREAFAP